MDRISCFSSCHRIERQTPIPNTSTNPTRYVPSILAGLNIVFAICSSSPKNKYSKLQQQYSKLDRSDRLKIDQFAQGLHSFSREGQLTESSVYLEHPFESQALETVLEAGWHSQASLSRAAGYSNQAQQAWEDGHRLYCFSVSWSNVHTTFGCQERPISLYFPLQIGRFKQRVFTINTEAAFHLAKVALFLVLIKDPDKRVEASAKMWETISEHDVESLSPSEAANQLRRLVNLDTSTLAIWDRISCDVMKRLLIKKIQNSPYLQCQLMISAPHPIAQLQYSPKWGTGYEGEGQNLLGQSLEQVRGTILDDRPVLTPELDKFEQKFNLNFYR